MEKYEVIEIIGKGSFGSVTKIRRRADSRILVWKEIHYGLMSEKEKQQLVAEVNILRELKHPNIVRYYDRIIDKPTAKIFIVMEYCEGGDLGRMLKKYRAERELIPEERIWRLFTQIVAAIHQCHVGSKSKILHRDLNPGNVFLDRSHNVKLGDFGWSRILGEESHFARTKVKTSYYMSPEQINESQYNEACDIWGIGCLLYEMASLRPPFEAKTQMELAIKIRQGRVSDIPSCFSPDLMRVIQWTLSVDPNQRPTIQQLQGFVRNQEPQQGNSLRQREDNIKRREEDLKRLKEQLDAKEKELDLREKQINEKTQQQRLSRDPSPRLGRDSPSFVRPRTAQIGVQPDRRRSRESSPLNKAPSPVGQRPKTSYVPISDRQLPRRPQRLSPRFRTKENFEVSPHSRARRNNSGRKLPRYGRY